MHKINSQEQKNLFFDILKNEQDTHQSYLKLLHWNFSTENALK